LPFPLLLGWAGLGLTVVWCGVVSIPLLIVLFSALQINEKQRELQFLNIASPS